MKGKQNKNNDLSVNPPPFSTIRLISHTLLTLDFLTLILGNKTTEINNQLTGGCGGSAILSPIPYPSAELEHPHPDPREGRR